MTNYNHWQTVTTSVLELLQPSVLHYEFLGTEDTALEIESWEAVKQGESRFCSQATLVKILPRPQACWVTLGGRAPAMCCSWLLWLYPLVLSYSSMKTS